MSFWVCCFRYANLCLGEIPDEVNRASNCSMKSSRLCSGLPVNVGRTKLLLVALELRNLQLPEDESRLIVLQIVSDSRSGSQFLLWRLFDSCIVVP